jgi:hypothetical protein
MAGERRVFLSVPSHLLIRKATAAGELRAGKRQPIVAAREEYAMVAMFNGPYSHPLPSGDRTMASGQERTSAAWFGEAARSYVQGHQACAWCGGAHCVFQRQRGSRLEYSCIQCGFYVCRDEQTAQFHVVPGNAIDPDSVIVTAS